MKRLLFTLAIPAALFAGSFAVRSDSKTPAPRAAVLISARQTYHYVQYINEQGYTNSYGQADGMSVEFVSPSSNLPSVPFGTSLGEAIAFYLGQGLHLQPQPVYGLYLLTN